MEGLILSFTLHKTGSKLCATSYRDDHSAAYRYVAELLFLAQPTVIISFRSCHHYLHQSHHTIEDGAVPIKKKRNLS